MSGLPPEVLEAQAYICAHGVDAYNIRQRRRIEARRKQIYEALHPETKSRSNQRTRVRQVGEGSPAPSFVESAAAAKLAKDSEYVRPAAEHRAEAEHKAGDV